MKLYTYWRSSAAYRVRIGLALKGLDFDSAPVHLLKDGGEQLSDIYGAVNPQKLVPSLELDSGEVLTQSLAILEYLDDVQPEPALLPADPLARAKVRAMAQAIAVDVHPINNLRILKYLVKDLGLSDDQKMVWLHHWMGTGFAGLEGLLAQSDRVGAYCYGDAPTLADVCLVPQFYNARRFDVDLSPYPTLCRIDETCRAHPAFVAAAPENQPDAE